MAELDYLTPILARKRRENARRTGHERLRARLAPLGALARVEKAEEALRRGPDSGPRIIAEIKRRSPSAGVIRPYARGDIAWLAQEYVAGGAAAISVLCDGAGFAGSALDLRRAASAVSVPLLFKEFVLDELQLDLAARAGASMALLIVRAMPPERLQALSDAALARGIAPVVEAANAAEVEVALQTRATIVGVNARDLRTFKVDPSAAQQALALIPRERIAVHMSGVRSAADYASIAQGRADALLIGESLMRAPKPSAKLRELRAR